MGQASSTALTGTVVSADRSTHSLYVADARGHVFLILGRRALAPGSEVRVRGDLSADGWTIVSSGPAGSVRRIGSATRVLVRGELGFVDVQERRFQLAAHGQIVGDVTFPVRLSAALHALQLSPPHRGDLRFRLGIRRGRLLLLALPT